METTHWPTLASDGFPIYTVGRSRASIFSSATSLGGSIPTTEALNSRRSVSSTLIWVAPATTLASVRMYPYGLIMKPDPRLPDGNMPSLDRPGENCLKNWTNGSCSIDAGGQSGIRLATWLARAALILTTAAPFCRTISAKSVVIPVERIRGGVGMAPGTTEPCAADE